VNYVPHFPPGTVHLRVVLDGPGQQPPCTIRITMRMASRIIYVEQTAEDAISAYDLAVRALLGELKAMKAAFSGEQA
jgi:hypothetical protein